MKKNKIIKILSIILIILILVCIALIITVKKNMKKSDDLSRNTSVQTNNEGELEIEKLKKMTERDRMEFYFSKFVSYIKSDDYEKAYSLLYPEFKENYFKTQEQFESYVKKLYPKTVGFSYNDIDRQGDIYVLLIDIMDTNKKITDKKSQRVVIKENNFNDFVLSFQVL